MGEDATKIGAPEFERLFDFLDGLRASGYTIDTRRLMALNDLLLALIASGETFDDLGRLKTLIAPLLCSTPSEQEDFYQQFESFVTIQKHRNVSPLPEAKPVSGQPISGKAKNPFAGLGALLSSWIIRPFSDVYKQNQFLTRETTDKIPEIIRFSVEPLLGDIFPRMRILLTAKEFRRRKQVASSEINIDKTIEASAAQNGWLTLVYKYRQVMPEYLILIERQARLDQQARFANEIFKELKDNGVWIHSYYFNDDPRVCFAIDQQNIPINLHDLQAKHGDCRLLILSGTETFFNPVTGELFSWTRELFDWEDRAIFLPSPEPRGYYANLLAQDFAVFPFSLVNLVGFLNYHENEITFGKNGSPAQPIPDALIERPLRWIMRDALPQPEVDDMVSRLRAYLGSDGYHWLAACAYYPELHWEITLYLGNAITADDGAPLLDAQRLQKLARLPWLRRGYMPDWFRLSLIESLDTDQSEKVRNALNMLLSTASAQQAGEFELEIADQTRNSFIQRLSSLWKTLTRRVPENALARDAIFVRFVVGGRRRKLSVRVNESIRKLLTRSTSVAAAIPLTISNYWQRLTQPRINRNILDAVDSVRKTLVGGNPRRKTLATLKILDGPKEMIGQELNIYAESVKLGRDPQKADITFYAMDKYSSVSGLHAMIERVDGEWRVVALSQSLSPTVVDGKEIPFAIPVFIHNGQKIQLGSWDAHYVVFEFQSVDVASAVEINQNSALIDRKIEQLKAELQEEREKKQRAMDNQLRVFISYSQIDKEKVTLLYNALLKAGVMPWVDFENLLAGQSWDIEIQRAIEKTDCILICLSRNSISKNEFQNYEIQAAINQNNKISPAGQPFLIPVRLEECEIPDRLNRITSADLYRPDGLPRLLQALQFRANELKRAPVELPETYQQENAVESTKSKPTPKKAAAAIKLSSNQRKQLLNILLGCRSLDVGYTRNDIITSLPSNISTLAVLDGPQKLIIDRLIDACISVPNGLEILAQALKDYEGETEAVEELYLLLKMSIKVDEIRVEGLPENLMAFRAKCCKPEPGDEIVAYITRGRGATIHRKDCENLKRQMENDPQRAYTVTWPSGNQETPYGNVLEKEKADQVRSNQKSGIQESLQVTPSIIKKNEIVENYLKDISLDDLRKEKIRLEQEERKMLARLQEVEKQKKVLFDDGVKKSNSKEAVMVARRIQEKDAELNSLDNILKDISKESRILNGLILIKETSLVSNLASLNNLPKSEGLEYLIGDDVSEDEIADLIRSIGKSASKNRNNKAIDVQDQAIERLAQLIQARTSQIPQNPKAKELLTLDSIMALATTISAEYNQTLSPGMIGEAVRLAALDIEADSQDKNAMVERLKILNALFLKIDEKNVPLL